MIGTDCIYIYIGIYKSTIICKIAFTIIEKVTFSLFCRFLKEIPPLSKLKEECELLKQVVDNMETRIVLCHNDLLWTNIIYDEKSGK
jgi:thiamine kinase-like enzyme